MATVNVYIDLLTRRAIRSPSSASPAVRPDFRDPTSHTLNVYFLRRNDNTTENYSYTRFTTATPTAKLRRNKPPDYGSFILNFAGVDSPPIDIRLSAGGIGAMIGSMASIGADNVRVTGDMVNGWTVEFINELAGYTQPVFTGRMSAGSANGEVVVKQVTAGGNGVNAVQTIKLREAAYATATGWVELTAGSNWGWSASIDASSIPQSIWDKGDLILDITLDAQGVRTGMDGITALEGTTRSGSDGQVVAVGAETRRSANARMDSNGVAYLVAQDGSTNYGVLFTQDDVGRAVTNNQFVTSDAVIQAVLDTPFYNAAILSGPFIHGYQPGESPAVTFDLGSAPSRLYKSATAAFTTNDVGHEITGDDLAPDTTIEGWIAADTVKLSKPALRSGDGKAWTITAIPGNIFQSATIAFGLGDVGAKIEAPQIPAGTIITSVIDATHATMSQKALGVASGQSWTLRPKIGFSAPTVTQITPGTVSTKEKQRISLTQTPIGGRITLRDSGDISLPIAVIEAPLTAQAIQAALNIAYPNYAGVTVTELIAGAQYDINFGCFGKQYVLAIDESQAVYERLVATIPLGDPTVEPTGEPLGQQQIQLPAFNKYNTFNLIMLGVSDDTFIGRIGQPIVTTVPDGTYGTEVRLRYAKVMDAIFQNLTPILVGSAPLDNPSWNARYDRSDNIEDRAGLRIFDWVGYKIPSNRFETQQQQRPVYIVPIQVLNGNIQDMQIVSVSVSTWIQAKYTYGILSTGNGALVDASGHVIPKPVDGPAGSVIHFAAVPGFQAQEWPWFINGFLGPFFSNGQWHSGPGTYGNQFTQSWSRRRWKADIWEQIEYIN